MPENRPLIQENDTIERVARALSDHNGEYPWDLLREGRRESWRLQARVALFAAEARRERKPDPPEWGHGPASLGPVAP